MIVRLKAWLWLTWAVVASLVTRLLDRGASGLVRFRSNYDADGLPPLTAAERQQATAFGRCIACGLCDRGEAERIAGSKGAYGGIMSLMVSASRSMPDYRAAAYSFSFVPDEVLKQKERVCPTSVPMLAIAEFVRNKAAIVGGPLVVGQSPPIDQRVT